MMSPWCSPPDDSRIALGCYDSCIRVWDSRSGKQELQLVGHSGG